VIITGILGALLVVCGSIMKMRYGNTKRILADVFNYIGYGFFFLSLLIYITIGFR
jgi:hypothetical protein